MLKKYLVTGASGFVAYYLFEYLNSLCENFEILGIDVGAKIDLKSYNYKNLKFSFESINLLDYPSLENILVSFMPTHIIHLASFSSVAKSWHDPVKSFSNNTNIFLNLVEIIRKNKIVCRIISVGSSEEYGNVQADYIPIKESEKLKPISPYAIARVSQEMLSLCYVSYYNLDIILTRSFNHIGPRQNEMFVIPSFVKQILEQNKNVQSDSIKILTGDVSLIRDFTDVRDIVRAYYLLLEKGVTGEIYNICSGIGHSIREIINILSSLLGKKIIIQIDKDRIRPEDNKIIIGDNSKIFKETGWKPNILIKDSLLDIIQYWQEILNENCI